MLKVHEFIVARNVEKLQGCRAGVGGLLAKEARAIHPGHFKILIASVEGVERPDRSGFESESWGGAGIKCKKESNIFKILPHRKERYNRY